MLEGRGQQFPFTESLFDPGSITTSGCFHQDFTGVYGDKMHKLLLQLQYPLVNIQKTMENHHFSWANPV